jgi:hypothetical protein
MKVEPIAGEIVKLGKCIFDIQVINVSYQTLIADFVYLTQISIY